MKIKSQNPATINIFNIAYWLKKKFIFTIFIALIFFSILSVFLIFYGASLQKNQTAASMQQIIYNAAQTRLSVVANYFAGQYASTDRIKLDLDFEGVQLLNFARDSALSKGMITDEEQDLEVKADLSIGSKTYKVKLSPTGLNLDMIGSVNKRAYKVKVLGGEKIYGMSEFKLLPPGARHHLAEWVGHALELKEGLIALRYFFVEATLNGKNLGVYAIEEHFNKELLENRNAREGIIFSEKEGRVRVFNEKKYKKNNDLNKLSQARLIRSAIQSIKNDEIDIGRIFDLQKFAKHLAIIELMNSFHAFGINSFYYFNPVSNLIEPITREYNSLRYSEGPPNPHYFSVQLYQSDKETFFLLNKISKNKDFLNYYLNELRKLSTKDYLDKFFDEVRSEMTTQLNIIYKEDPFYKFPQEYMYQRQDQILAWLNGDLNIAANVDVSNVNSYEIRFKNNSPFPISLLRIFTSDNKFNNTIDKVLLPEAEIFYSFELNDETEVNDFNYSYQIHGIDNKIRDRTIAPWSKATGVLYPDLWDTSYNSLLNHKGININEANQTISFNSNNVDIKENLFIPKDFLVVGHPGLIINLLDGASIYSKSAFNFSGLENNQIKITSLNQSGGGVAIISPEQKSVFTNTIFENLASPNPSGSGLTASITLYNTLVSFAKCTFKNNSSEDFLNLVGSIYTLSDSYFTNVNSDAVDSDFSHGSIEDTNFFDIGNDAIDFSGSSSKLFNILIDSVGDKALSAGENSKLSGKNVRIINAEIGITSKDLSSVTLDDVNIKDTQLGFAIFQKKEEFGGADSIISDLEMQNVSVEYLVDLNSSLNLNGKDIKNKREEVADLLYGATFGKSSK